MLPTNAWISAHDMLQGYVELSQPASMKELRRISSFATDSTEKAILDTIVSSDRTNEASRENMSTLDLLERFPSINLSFSEFLTSLPPLRIRLYSISSSPLYDPTVCSITCSVLKTPRSSSWSSAHLVGVVSTYLSTLSPDDRVHFVLRANKSDFHFPPSGLAAPVPIIMICAGTGIAPFRAFSQERMLQMSAQSAVNLAPALLFVGCRSQVGDRLYAEEFDAWKRRGAVDGRYAFSRETEKQDGCKYVQDRIARNATEVKDL